MKADVNAIRALWKREIVRLLRQTGRIVGAIGQPLLLWVFLSAGIGRTFQMKENLPADVSYGEFFFPGAVVMILLFTAIFSTISVIEDRKEGLLRTMLVAPVSRFSIAAGKCAGGTTIAMLQGGIMLLLLLTPFVQFSTSPGQVLYLIAVMGVISGGFTALGFGMAWFFESTQSYHGMMSFFLIPMWMLSGALFPIKNLPGWLDLLMRLNPLTYGLEAFRAGLYPNYTPPAGLVLHSVPLNLTVTVLFAGAMFAGAVFICRYHR